jgi:hypothetical protein
MNMLSILFSILYFWFLWWAYRRYPWIIVASFFLLFGFTFRTVGAVYIDIFGPVFASELDYDIGPGSSTPLFVITVLLVIGMIVAFQARPGIAAENVGKTPFGIQPSRMASLAFAGTAAWVAACYIEMIAIGPIPFFVGMDRIEYQDNFAGQFYETGYSLAFLFSLVTGYFFATRRIYEGRYDYRFFYVMSAQVFFFFLTGNRFSIFFTIASFFVIPISAISLMKSKSGLLPPDANTSALHKFITNRFGRIIAAGLAATVFAAILINNTFNVRYTGDSDEAQSKLLERILVQPVELYVVTWSRIASGELADTSLAWDLIFGNPIDPTRNTGIQYLMVTTLGEERATEILDQNSQYAGGYPEVLIELFGLQLSIWPMVLAALIVAILYRQIMLSVCYCRFFTFICSGYVLFGFMLLYIGGMVNFLLAWTFWVKISAMVLMTFIEPYLMQPARPRFHPQRGDMAFAQGSASKLSGAE